MPDDLIPFSGGVALLVLYLVWSATTEMGARWPRSNAKTKDQD